MKKFITAMLIAASLSTTAFAFEAPEGFFDNFQDLDSEETYKDGILLLKQHGIIKGQGETGEFKPKNKINRAEMLKILVESLYADGEKFNDLPNPYTGERKKLKEELEKFKTKCFNDVPADAWFTKYVCYAKAKGWVKGYGNGNFRPGQEVNFVEALKMALEAHGIAYDEDKTEWYRGLVKRAAHHNLIPYDVAEFGEELRRNQMADLVARIIRHKQGRLEDYLGERKDIRVDYDTIKARRNLRKERQEQRKEKREEKKTDAKLKDSSQ